MRAVFLSGFLLTVLCLHARVISTNLSIDVWQVEHGLPGNTISSIVQTPDGYLWLGTFHGPVRFDGVRFETFGPDTPGLANERVTKLFLDQKGTLWLAMEYGQLARYADGKFRSFRPEDGWPGERAHPFANSKDGTVLLATATRVFEFKEERFHVVASNNVRAVSMATPVVVDTEGRTWVGANDMLGVIQDGKLTPLTGELATTNIRDMVASRNGGVWVCGDEKIRLLRDNKWARDLGAPAHIAKDTPTMMEDSLGRLWLGTWRNGLFCFLPDGTMHHYSKETGLPQSAVRTLSEDREGNIWVGLNGGGLVRMKPRVFQTFPRSSGVTNMIFGIAEDTEQRLWLGTLEDGLWQMENGRFSPAKGAQFILPWSAWTVLADRSGTIWMGTHAGYTGGLLRHTNGKWTRYGTNEGLVHYDVLCLLESRDGSMWIGTDHGLSHFRDGKFSNYTQRDGLAAEAVRALAEDRRGNVWIGTTGGGLHQWHDGKFTNFRRKDGMPSDSVHSLMADDDGTLWVGTSSGLGRFRNGQFQGFSSKNGLSADFILRILDDGLGFLWLGTSRGIVRVARTELDALANGSKSRLDCTTYLKTDGLESIQCTSGGASGIRARDGRLWFATQGGLSVVNPREIFTNQIAPQLAIESVFVDGEQKTATASGAVEVPAGRRQVEVRYTGLSFTAPERVHFKCRLDGFDSQWQEVGTRRSAYYQGLPPGQYRFRVLAANNDGVWNNEGASLALIVQPAFWQTIWFRLWAVIGLGGAVFALYRRRVGLIEQRRQQQQAFTRQLLESQETERRRIASELHDSLGQDLVLVKNLATLGEQTQGAPGQSHFTEIATATTRALDEVHAISYALRPPELDRLGLSKAVAAMIRRAEESSGIKFARHLELTAPLPPGADIQLFRIAQEVVGNLLKHSRAKNARVEIWQDEAGVHLVIADDGCGFNVSERSGASGLGLAGIEERVQLLGAKCEIISRPNEGTTVSVLVPAAPVRSTPSNTK